MCSDFKCVVVLSKTSSQDVLIYVKNHRSHPDKKLYAINEISIDPNTLLVLFEKELY